MDILLPGMFYRPYNIVPNAFKFSQTNVTAVTKILENIDSSKATGIDNLGGKFIKDGTLVIAFPITQICNLSIKYCSFPDAFKFAKVKPLLKKAQKQILKTINHFPFYLWFQK